MKQEPGNASSQESPGFSRGEEVNNVRELSDSELAELEHAVEGEVARRSQLAAIPEQVADLNERYERSQEDSNAVPFEPVPHFGHGPGTTVTWDDGEEWKNISGAWLTVSPADYPLGWAQQTGLPDDVPQWGPGIDVTAGDLLEYQGTVYRVIQPHTTADHWRPDGLPALYTPQG